MGALSDLSKNIDNVVRGYVEAMLWANAWCGYGDCEDGREVGECEHTRGAEKRFGLEDFSDADQRTIRDEVENFVIGNLPDFNEYLERRDCDPSEGTPADYFGHDFALTRNGHGAGFWDRGLGELGDRLTAASKPYGESSINIGENGPSI